MKFRKGFVTNSSSSSFIVATSNKGGETFLDMIRYLGNNYSSYEFEVEVVFPEEEIKKGNWSQFYYPEAAKRVEELKQKNVYEVTIESDEVIEIMRKASDNIEGFELVCKEY